MEEILHHLGCIKLTLKHQWDELPTSTGAGLLPSTGSFKTHSIPSLFAHQKEKSCTADHLQEAAPAQAFNSTRNNPHGVMGVGDPSKDAIFSKGIPPTRNKPSFTTVTAWGGHTNLTFLVKLLVASSSKMLLSMPFSTMTSSPEPAKYTLPTTNMALQNRAFRKDIPNLENPSFLDCLKFNP